MTIGPPGAVLAVDLGGTTMRAAVVDHEGHLVERCAAPTPHDERCPEALVALVSEVLERHPVAEAVIGVPGRVNYRTGQLEQAPNLPPGWTDALREDALGDVVGVPVNLANDADMAAVGEARFGAGHGFDDVVYVTVSTGVGAGVVLGGQLARGSRSLGEIGHTVIDRVAARREEPATVEELGSGRSLARSADAAGLDAEGADLVALVVDGDSRAQAVWDEAMHVAGLAVANLAHLFSPEVVVVGGGVGRSGDVVLAPVRELLAAFGPLGLREHISVVTAALGDDAGLIGAAGWRAATESAGDNPSGGLSPGSVGPGSGLPRPGR